MHYLFTSPSMATHPSGACGSIICDEINRVIPSLNALGIKFFLSHITSRIRDGKPRKLPYLSCRYNVGNLGGVNIVAYYHSLTGDWELMDRQVDRYRIRVRSAIREEMIHAVQILTVKSRYDRSIDLRNIHRTAESYYEFLLGKIVDELVVVPDATELILAAARLYYEDATITSMAKLRATDQRLHGRSGYLVSELIRQLVQIRCGEPLSEEAKGKAWDKNRVFRVGEFGTTENLLKSMATTLRAALPKLVELSPTLAEALFAIERTIQKIQQIQPRMAV
jgi:hypothetical protein